MTEAIQSKDEKVYALSQCLGRLSRHTVQVNSAGYMIRDITESGMDQREDTEVVICNGLLAATSLMMTDLDKLKELLELPNPDWDEIRQNQPAEWELEEAIKDAEKLAEGQKD